MLRLGVLGLGIAIGTAATLMAGDASLLSNPDLLLQHFVHAGCSSGSTAFSSLLVWRHIDFDEQFFTIALHLTVADHLVNGAVPPAQVLLAPQSLTQPLFDALCTFPLVFLQKHLRHL